MDKTLILVRHAHRSKKQGRELDNGLSEKGKEQARRIKRYFKKVYPKDHPLIVSSPKLRCVETILPLAGNKKGAFEILPILDEGANLTRRVKEFIRWWKNDAPTLTLVCSHGDWIPVCIELLTGANIELEKGGWAEITLFEGKPKLTSLIQNP